MVTSHNSFLFSNTFVFSRLYSKDHWRSRLSNRSIGSKKIDYEKSNRWGI